MYMYQDIWYKFADLIGKLIGNVHCDKVIYLLIVFAKLLYCFISYIYWDK